MICDVCKTHEACVIFTEIRDGAQKVVHLCKSCALEYAGVDSKHITVLPGGMLVNFIMEMFKKHQEMTTLDDNELKKTNLICPVCHTTYDEYLKYDKVGCSECYATFGLILDSHLDEIQGAHQHMGEPPEGLMNFVDIPELIFSDDPEVVMAKALEMETLKQLLDQAVADEDFEMAAILRDQLREKRVSYESAE